MSRRLMPKVIELQELSLAAGWPIDNYYQWRTRNREFFYPRAMETRHIFMTLVLIWNHTMPETARFTHSGNWKHHMYNLGPAYTEDYLKRSIYHLAVELVTRTDMEAAWEETLNNMIAFLRTRQLT